MKNNYLINKSNIIQEDAFIDYNMHTFSIFFEWALKHVDSESGYSIFRPTKIY